MMERESLRTYRLRGGVKFLNRATCRVIGHRWKWVRGWVEYECSRCGARG